MCDVCDSNSGLNIILPTGCLAYEIYEENPVLGLVAYNIISNINLSLNIGNISIGLKKCNCESDNCTNNVIKECIFHRLYAEVEN